MICGPGGERPLLGTASGSQTASVLSGSVAPAGASSEESSVQAPVDSADAEAEAEVVVAVASMPPSVEGVASGEVESGAASATGAGTVLSGVAPRSTASTGS